MLKLRRGRVVSVEQEGSRRGLARLAIRIEPEGMTRRAIAYPALTGPVLAGDEVVVNVEAQDLGLGSGGFDILCANLTRGLDERSEEDEAQVVKLNYTPIQHAVRVLEEGLEQFENLTMPVAVLALHGQLPPAAFALAARLPGVRVGYVQTDGGALPGALSDVAATLLDRGLLADHVTVAPSVGGRREAITRGGALHPGTERHGWDAALEGALHAGTERLGWDAALVGPGPGILGSASALGHGGLAALHSAHSALSLGCTVVFAPRVSSCDERERHRGLSHHTRTVLKLLLRPVAVAVPAELSASGQAELQEAIKESGHEALEVAVDDLMPSYLDAGLPAETMSRSFREDRDFFSTGLAAGAALASRAGGSR